MACILQRKVAGKSIEDNSQPKRFFKKKIQDQRPIYSTQAEKD